MGDYYSEAPRSSAFDDRADRGGDYDEQPRRWKSTRTRPRRRDDADYVEETTFIERGKGKPPQELIYRGRDRDDDIEEVQRDFSPPGASRRPRGYDDYGNVPRRARSMASRTKDRFEDDADDVAAPAAGAAAGAAAGYAAGRRGSRSARDRGRRDSYYSEDDRSEAPRKKERRKSGIESALAGLGLGGVAGALTGNRDRSGSRERAGGRSTSRPRGEKKQREWAQAAQAALIAGAVEAFRSRGEPGPWTGDKGKRIATAAIGAGGIDKIVDRDPDHKSKRHLVEAVLGGLAANRLANGPTRSKSRGRGRSGSRSPSRSRSRSVFSRYRSKSRGRRGSSGSPAPTSGDKIKDLAAGGILAGVGKQLYDQYQKRRSKSRGGGGRRRSPSSGSDDSYAASRGRGGRDRDVGGPPNGDRGGPDDGAVVGPRGRGGAAGAGAAAEGGSQRGGSQRGGSNKGSDSESLSSTDIENRRKKMRGKEFLTAGLASIATIHAAHGVYSTMQSSEKRHKLVAEGEMSPEEARKKRSKAWLQDAAAIGIAALGIKGAYSEWKEMNEQRHSVMELEERRRKRAKKRESRMKEASEGGGGGRGGGGGGRRQQQQDDSYMSGGLGRDDGGYGGGGPRYQDGNPYGGGGGGGGYPPPPNGYR